MTPNSLNFDPFPSRFPLGPVKSNRGSGAFFHHTKWFNFLFIHSLLIIGLKNNDGKVEYYYFRGIPFLYSNFYISNVFAYDVYAFPYERTAIVNNAYEFRTT